MHSRIFQFSDKEIKKEDYIKEHDMFVDEHIWGAFSAKYCGDYVTEQNEEDRLEDIKWLSESLGKLDITLVENDRFLLGENFREKINGFWYGRIHKAFNELDKDKMDYYPPRYNLKYACMDPLCMGFGFLFYNEDTFLSQSDEFFEWLLAKNPGDLVYIGATLDYHC